MDHRGRWKQYPKLAAPYTKSYPEEVFLPLQQEGLLEALVDHRSMLERRNKKMRRRIADRQMTRYDQLKVTKWLIQCLENRRPGHDSLDFYLSWGRDRRGNTYFTGYYTPVIQGKRRRDALFKHAIYGKPNQWKGPLPTRHQIEAEKALKGLGLELAYTDDPLELYYMHLQGSGMVQLVDEKTDRLFAYDGTNKKRYRSIERILSRSGVKDVSIDGLRQHFAKYPQHRDSVLNLNPSYVFFREGEERVIGSGGVPLVDFTSVAADPDIFPLGTILLATIPRYSSETGQLLGHDWRILLVQDKGGAINGRGHLDFYCGTGDEARDKASQHYHYGRIWVVLPKATAKNY
ncbi:MAG: MltA domain-containing protein [Bacteroidota bacterium]